MLDNCEHVIATAAEVAEDLLRRCPRLRLLATSREGLRVGGEAIWPVPPLGARRRQRAVPRPRRGRGGATRPLRRARWGGRGDLRPARRPAARDRARRGPDPRLPVAAGPVPAERPVPVAHRWVADGAAAPADAAGRRRLELRPAVRRRAAGVRPAVGVPRWLRSGHRPGRVRRRAPRRRSTSRTSSRRSSTSRSSTPRPARPTCASASCRPWPSTAARSWPSAARRDRSATPWRPTTPASARRRPRPTSVTSSGRWLITVGEEQDNLRAALEWAVANDDAETALDDRRRASWAHWLAGTAVEAKRWLDEAFACGGERPSDVHGDGPRRAAA